MSHDAVERRLERARRLVGAPTTPLAPLATSLLVAAAIGPALLGTATGAWRALLGGALSAAAAAAPPDAASCAERLWATLEAGAGAVLPTLAALAACAVAVTLAQTGGLVVAWRGDGGSRLAGATRSSVDAARGARSALRASVLVVAIGAPAGLAVADALPALASLHGRCSAAPDALVRAARTALFAQGAALALAAAAELAIARRQFRQSFGLTTHEAARLERDDGLSSGARAALAAARRETGAWPASTLAIVVRGGSSATLVTFDPERDHAPVVRDRRQGAAAAALAELSERRGAHAVEDRALAALLAEVAVGEHAPEEAFAMLAVAFRAALAERAAQPPTAAASEVAVAASPRAE